MTTSTLNQPIESSDSDEYACEYDLFALTNVRARMNAVEFAREIKAILTETWG